jgi:hypothetical protein
MHIDLPETRSPNMMFSNLIWEVFDKDKIKPAILIDEYDAPVTKLLDQPDEMEPVRKSLRDFYTVLKANDANISFTFVTGITKYVQGGLYSAFNNPIDISFKPEYGAITGFTHEEIKKYYRNEIEDVAKNLKNKPATILRDMKYYYNGFCFDAETLVYNPFSTVLFFDHKKPRNFWFYTGTPQHLVPFLKKVGFDMREYRGIKIPEDNLMFPIYDRFNQPEVYLFQLGFLTLKPGTAEEAGKEIDYKYKKKEYTLDYPNIEVKESLGLLIFNSYVDNDIVFTKGVCEKLRDAIKWRDTAKLVEILNGVLTKKHLSFFKKDPSKKKNRHPGDVEEKERFDETNYRCIIHTLFEAARLDPQTEKGGSKGYADIALTFFGQTWVFELKVKHIGDHQGTEAKMAENALKQMVKTNYGESFENPVLLAIVINDSEGRRITAWKALGGTKDEPDPKPQLAKEQQPLPAEEEESTGPKP